MRRRSRRRKWSDLHEDLLILIARKLQAVEDILLFRSVCVSWRSASKVDKLDGTRQFPLLLKYFQLDYCFNYTYMFDHARCKVYKAPKFSDNFRSWYLGWKGWVLVVDLRGTLRLIHAFKKTKPIILPRILKSISISKAVLSSDPFINASEYALAIIFHDRFMVSRGQLLLWMPGDKSYTTMKVDGVHDAIFHAGLLYAVKYDRVMVFDVARHNPRTIYQIRIGIPCDVHTDEHYLADLGGDLLLIKTSKLSEYRQFNVFLVSELSEWKEVKDLGNIAIFIGTNQTFVLNNASEVQGCRPNHIYLAIEEWPKSGHVGTYNLTNGEYRIEGEGTSLTPLWVQPTFD